MPEKGEEVRVNEVCLYERERERDKGQKLSSILRIKLVFTRLNFNLRLNSSPQFKRTMAKGNERQREREKM